MFTFQLATIDLLPIKTQNRKCVTTPASCYKWLGVPARCYESLNFPAKLCGWIRECVTTPAYSISLNGEVWGFFPAMQGLRQGDPLSPYLIILCIEYLSRLLKVRTYTSDFKFHPKFRQHWISHLAFADDLMVMAWGYIKSVQILADVLEEFGAVSGLKVNRLKSNLFLAGVDQQIEFLLRRCWGLL